MAEELDGFSGPSSRK